MYFVPDKKDTNGIDTILMNTVGNKIFKIIPPFIKSFPNIDNIVSDKI